MKPLSQLHCCPRNFGTYVTFPLLLTIFFMAETTGGLQAAAFQAEAKSEKPTGVDSQIKSERMRFADEMNDVAHQAMSLGLAQEAKMARAQVVSFTPDRQVIFMPRGMILSQSEGAETKDATEAQTKAQESFHRRLKKSKSEYAARLFAFVPELLKEGRGAAAYQLIHEVLVYDPLHAEALRVLGFRKHEKLGWIRSARTTRAAKGRAEKKLIGWKKGSYWTITSPHFKIYSAPGEEAGLQLAEELERTYWVWRQVFFEYQSSGRQVSDWLNKNRSDSFSKRQPYEVYLFRDRQQYIRDLAVVPNIEQSTGYYDDRAEASFFYAGDDSSLATWRHETVHQLLKENAGATSIDEGTRAHAWLVEGVALYFETMKVYDHHVTLGGWDADRLQYARRRFSREGFYIPLATFDAMTRDQLQARSDKGRVYSQAAGIAQMFMAGNQGRYRDRFIQFVKEYYRERRMKNSLDELTLPFDQLDRHYKQFLEVDVDQLRAGFASTDAQLDQIKVLSLSRVGITKSDLKLIKNCRNMEWLELSQNRITDAGLKSLFEEGPDQLSELYLDVTAITDQSASVLGKLKTLQVLDLASTNLTDESVKQLAALEELQILYLANTKLTDEGLAKLAELPKLQFLDVRETSVTPKMIEKLKKAKSSLEILR